MRCAAGRRSRLVRGGRGSTLSANTLGAGTLPVGRGVGRTRSNLHNANATLANVPHARLHASSEKASAHARVADAEGIHGARLAGVVGRDEVACTQQRAITTRTRRKRDEQQDGGWREGGAADKTRLDAVRDGPHREGTSSARPWRWQQSTRTRHRNRRCRGRCTWSRPSTAGKGSAAPRKAYTAAQVDARPASGSLPSRADGHGQAAGLTWHKLPSRPVAQPMSTELRATTSAQATERAQHTRTHTRTHGNAQDTLADGTKRKSPNIT